MQQPGSEGVDTVLVVDDSPDSLNLVTDVLETAGMTALVATDGAQALSIAARIVPDLILLDAVMPGQDGFETCRQLKRMSNVADVPVIFMTGLTEPEHVVRGFEAGGVDYVTKPIAPDALIARLRARLASVRRMLGAHAALDLTGRHLLAVDQGGNVVWATPEATRMISQSLPHSSALSTLPLAARAWVAHALTGSRHTLATDATDGTELQLTIVDVRGAGQILLRVARTQSLSDTSRLQQRLGLTPREAEVLLWIAQGKSNRDIADILSLSPRTVNKHLEQVYEKLGVENRTAAAARALECLGNEQND